MSLLSSQTQKRSARPELIPTSQKGSTPGYYVYGNAEEQRGFRVKPITLIIITLIIIIVIAVVTIILIRMLNRDQLEQQFEPEIIDLDALVDLKVDGQCCVTNANPIPNPTWIYSPSQDFSYSTNKTQPAIVCQSLVGQALTDCLANVSNPDGTPKVIAHRGIVSYYGFASGQPGAVCASLAACP